MIILPKAREVAINETVKTSIAQKKKKSKPLNISQGSHLRGRGVSSSTSRPTSDSREEFLRCIHDFDLGRISTQNSKGVKRFMQKAGHITWRSGGRGGVSFETLKAMLPVWQNLIIIWFRSEQ